MCTLFEPFLNASSGNPAPSRVLPCSPSSLARRQQDGLTCETVRAPNYYGFGVRLGIYCTWFQSLLANTLMPGEVSAALDRNSIFLFTLLVAMIKCSSIKMLMQIDGLILVHLSNGYVFDILSIWGYRTCHYAEEGPQAIRRYGGFRTHFRLCITLAICAFYLWFWTCGVSGALDPMGPSNGNPLECDRLYTMFMLLKVKADGGIRTLYIVAYSCCITYFGIMFLTSSVAGYSRVFKIVKLAKNSQWTQTSRLRYATGFSRIELKQISVILRWTSFLWLIFTILFVELTLHYNNVTAVLGGPNDNELHLPSQLLALMIGAFGLVRLCYLKFLDWRSSGDRNPSISESPQSPRTSDTDTGTPPLGLNLLKVFSSNFGLVGESPKDGRSKNDDATRESDPDGRGVDELDELVNGKSDAARYTISWLPWLALLRSQHMSSDDGKSGSGDTPLLENSNEMGDRYNGKERGNSCNLSIASSSTLREEHHTV